MAAAGVALPPTKPLVVVLDANILYPPILRDTAVALALEGLYQPKWSEEILEEARRNLARHIAPETAQQRIDDLRAVLPEAMVHDYAEHLAGLTNHPKDRHVVAAALQANASIIVTGNLRDFQLLPSGVTAQSPDDFMCGFLGQMDAVLASLERVRTNWPKPGPPHERLLKQLATFTPRLVDHIRSAL